MARTDLRIMGSQCREKWIETPIPKPEALLIDNLLQWRDWFSLVKSHWAYTPHFKGSPHAQRSEQQTRNKFRDKLDFCF